MKHSLVVNTVTPVTGENGLPGVAIDFSCSCGNYLNDVTASTTEAQARVNAGSHIRTHAQVSEASRLRRIPLLMTGW